MQTYAEFVLQRRLDEPIPREDDVGLRGDGLRKLKEQAGCLGEALRRKKDGFEDIAGERR